VTLRTLQAYTVEVDDEAREFSWDGRKSDACLADRGFDFALASRLF